VKTALAAVLIAALSCGCGPREETLSHGRFEKLAVLKPAGLPQNVALLITDHAGWNTDARHLAHTLAREGALVIGVPLPSFYLELEKEAGGCEFTDGDLENLSHFVQAYYRLPGYTAPVLVGFGEGAAFAYANLAQAPEGTFAGALTLGFCPQLHLQQELCAGEGFLSLQNGQSFDLQPAKKLPAPWITLQGEADTYCPPATVQSFAAQIPLASVTVQLDGARDFGARRWRASLGSAYARLAKNHPAAGAELPAELADLPLIEVPVPAAQAKPLFAVLWSGDGGWAGLDKDVADALSKEGVAVVGVDSLRYFWTARTPAGIAVDIDRIIRSYAARWQRDQVLLVGYSQGADVLPFALNRLSPASRARVKLAAAMGLSDHAVFEFHLSNWLADNNSGPATKPEVQKIHGIPFLCIYGDGEDDTICPQLSGSMVRVVKLPGGHHFDGDYDRLAEEILKAAIGATPK
jgi:type IV secretory pathway VirJ component